MGMLTLTDGANASITNCSFNSIQQEEKKMDTTYPATCTERQYLVDRLYEIFEEKNREALKTFGLIDDPQPHSAKELINRITSGRFVHLKEEEEHSSYIAGPLHFIRWCDPAVKVDRESYDVFEEKIEATMTKVRDDIAIEEPKKALASLRAFEKEKFH